jgi:glycosyltransferase involved in cell wall biosynthesis
MRPLHVYVPHASEMLTDYKAHGDGLIAHQTITRLAARGHTLHVAAPRAELQKPLPENVHLHVFEDAAGNGLADRLRYLRHARRLLKDLRKTYPIDLVHQVNPVFSGVTLGLVGCGLPIVLGTYSARWPNDPDAASAAGGIRGKLADAVRNTIAIHQQGRADALILSSRAALNQVPQAHLLRDRIHFIPYGIDTAIYVPTPGFDSAERLQYEQVHPSILFVANLHRRKGIFTLIEAFATVLKQIPACRLRVIGDGGEIVNVKKLADRLGCTPQIDYLGWQVPQKTLEHYRECTLTCVPSFGEPFGMVALEAMSCGRAVIVTRAGGLGTYVPEEGSRKVPMADVPALAAALIDLLAHPGQRAAMGRFNRAYAQANMDWQRVIDRTETVYDTVLKRSLPR